jgi:hypothetical protein
MVYDIALFLHIIGAIGIFSAVSVTTVCSVRMRHAQTVAQVRLLADLVGAIGDAIPLFAVTLVIPAAYMALTAWSFGDPWILAGFSVAVLLALTGSILNNRYIRSIQQASYAALDGPLPDSLRALVDAPFFRWSERILLALLVGVVFLMTTKPDVVGTPATLGVVVILALLSVLPLHRPSHRPQLASRSGGMQ